MQPNTDLVQDEAELLAKLDRTLSTLTLRFETALADFAHDEYAKVIIATYKVLHSFE